MARNAVVTKVTINQSEVVRFLKSTEIKRVLKKTGELVITKAGLGPEYEYKERPDTNYRSVGWIVNNSANAHFTEPHTGNLARASRTKVGKIDSL